MAKTTADQATGRKSAFNKVLEQAKNDPAFFHALVFDPEKTLASLDYLHRREKSMLVALKPEDVIAGLLNVTVNADGSVSACGDTCGDSSCNNTCGEQSCGGTCKSSCEGTCGRSCDHTTDRILEPIDLIETIRTVAELGRERAPNFSARRRFR